MLQAMTCDVGLLRAEGVNYSTAITLEKYNKFCQDELIPHKQSHLENFVSKIVHNSLFHNGRVWPSPPTSIPIIDAWAYPLCQWLMVPPGYEHHEQPTPSLQSLVFWPVLPEFKKHTACMS